METIFEDNFAKLSHEVDKEDVWDQRRVSSCMNALQQELQVQNKLGFGQQQFIRSRWVVENEVLCSTQEDETKWNTHDAQGKWPFHFDLYNKRER